MHRFLFWFVFVFVLIAQMAVLSSCKKDIDNPSNINSDFATVTTDSVEAITLYSATVVSTVSKEGKSGVTGMGIAYGKNPNPTVEADNNISYASFGLGSFNTYLKDLENGTTYYVRAYAINSAGIAYSKQVIFITIAVDLPTLTTTTVSSITSTTASSGGNISNDGGGAVTARGVVWGTSQNPTIALTTKTTDGTGTGIFTSITTGLSPGTLYYVRAYATNSAGTAYGNQVSFITIVVLPTLTTTISSITSTKASSGGNISNDGGGALTARGVVWSTSQNPTIALTTKTSDGTGTGSFTSNLTGLSPNTVYYLRAYATNAAGTAYGNQVSLTTQTGASINIETGLIPAGTFMMGSPTSELQRQTNEVQHQVTLSAFRMSKYEITNAQYAAFLNAENIGSNGLYALGTYPTQTLIYENTSWALTWTGTQWQSVAGKDNFPVVNATWYGAAEFATYAGGRLPTEAEWEYACRGNTTTPFSTGACLNNTQANYYWFYPFIGCTNISTACPLQTQAVNSYSPNAYGLYNMHGNVWEWCADWYGYDAYSTTAQTNPTGPESGTVRVLRGGCWINDAQYCRSAYRFNGYPDSGGKGFRLAFAP